MSTKDLKKESELKLDSPIMNDAKEQSSSDMLDFAGGELSELTVVAEGEERTTWFVWMLVSCATISGLLFGAPRDMLLSR